MSAKVKKVWFVTGASKGLGLALVRTLVKGGYKVAATSRNIEHLAKAVGEEADFLPLKVDLRDEQSVNTAILTAIERFGTIDVVVNNAGYGQLGTVEELTNREARQNFDINVFGTLNVIRSVMPHLRTTKSGYIINISSIVGFVGTFPGWGIYNGTKFAVAGLTEAFSEEVKSMGIKATVVYPGYFRTEFLSNSSLQLAETPISEYGEARALERVHETQIAGNQPGSPEKAAAVLIQLAENDNPPLHFFMGSDAVEMARTKIKALQNTITAYEALSKSTDF